MNSKKIKKKDPLEKHTDALISGIADGVDREIMKVKSQIPYKAFGQINYDYKLNQICVDVKIVDIQPDNERCIGFVYAKRDENGGLIKERGAKTLEPVWGEEISYMTLSDFEGFIESRKKCFTL